MGSGFRQGISRITLLGGVLEDGKGFILTFGDTNLKEEDEPKSAIKIGKKSLEISLMASFFASRTDSAF